MHWRRSELKPRLQDFTMQRERDLLLTPELQKDAAWRRRVIANKELASQAEKESTQLSRARRALKPKIRINEKAWKWPGSAHYRQYGTPEFVELVNQNRDLLRRSDDLSQRGAELWKKRDYLMEGGDPEVYDPATDIDHQLESQGWPGWSGSFTSNSQTRKPKFVSRCPRDGCKGLLDDDSKCILCTVQCCCRCLEPQCPDHECSKQVLDNIARIRKSCKPCPNQSCGTAIEKSYGCSQMWCPQCRTFFDWETMKVITEGPRHNPEYLRWMKEKGALPVGNRPECDQLSYFICQSFGHSPHRAELLNYWLDVLQLNNHALDALQQKRDELAPYRSRNRHLAVKHLAGEIDEEAWGSQVMRNNEDADTEGAVIEAFEFLTLVLPAVISNALLSKTMSMQKLFEAQVAEAIAEFNRQMGWSSVCQQITVQQIVDVRKRNQGSAEGAIAFVWKGRKWKKSELEGI